MIMNNQQEQESLKCTMALIQGLLDEGIIKSVDELTEDKVNELIQMLKEDKDILKKN